MKKFLVVIAVLALTVISSVAMAEVTVSGSIDIRSLHLQNTSDYIDTANDRQNTTQERIRVNIDGKNDGVKGRITFENDWEVWGTEQNTTTGSLINPGGTGTTATSGVESRQGQSSAANKFGIREAWIDFTIPGAGPAHVKVGHQFLQLGNGWFFRSLKYGSDAWLVGLPGKNTVAFVDVKVGEGLATMNDDIDAYVLLDNFKIDDNNTVGAYFTRVDDRRGGFLGGTEANLDNIGLWYKGKVGPINLEAELDVQMGKAKGAAGGADQKFKGNQLVVQANMAAGPAKINATLARGSGQDLIGGSSTSLKEYLPVLDADPHYTVVYEYFAKTACVLGDDGAAAPNTRFVYAKNTGFCNTTAFNLGASMDVTKWLNVSLDYWMLKATEKVSIGNTLTTNTNLSDDLGNEFDLVLKFKLYDQLTWNWQIARLMAGKAYDTAGGSADNIDAIQGILSYKF